MEIYLLIFLVGAFAGVMTGLVGASGMLVVVPCMILLRYSAYQAIGISLAVDVVASGIVSVAYYRHGRVDLRRGLGIAAAAVVGAQFGSRWVFRVPEVGLSGGFGVLLLIAAVVFWRQGAGQGGLQTTIARFRASQLAAYLERFPGLTSAGLGFGVGIISGMFGVGGGIVFLGALLLLGYSLHEAVGTSTLIMTLTTLSGAIGHAMAGTLPYLTIIIATAGTVIGSLASARFANRLDERTLGIAIAILFMILGVGLIFLTVMSHLEGLSV
ncbi:MAG: sulfite exporter TauE/SafE family protein [Caldilineaceae bacterium]|nr:sulfite exporter TauE/SafE family protein [Caldilineaceae bacterium]